MIDDLQERGNATTKVGIVGIAGNIILFIIKIIIALASKSQSLFADSINSATDVLSSLMTLIGGKISSEPSDAKHNFGHGKAEYIFSLLISIAAGYLAVKIAITGVTSFVTAQEFEFSYLLVAVCLVTIIIKLSMYIYVHSVGKKMHNILIIANSHDHINDVMITSSVLIGAIFGKFGIYWVDGIVAIAISMKILHEALKIFEESYNVLMDVSMNEEEINEIKKIVESEKEVLKIDSIVSKAVGNNFIIVLKISMDGQKTIEEGHNIAGKIKSDIMKFKNVYDVVVHVNPK